VTSPWSRGSLLGGLLLALFATSLLADPPPDKKQIAEWIKDLGARQFARRDRAQHKLWEAGEVAEEALREATRSTDVEVKRRAEEVLARFKWGIYPSTPKKVVQLIEKYQSAEAVEKLALVRELFDQGGPGVGALLKIVAAEEAEDFRRQLNHAVSREAGRAIPLLAAEKNSALLEKLFELTLISDREASLPHYVAFHYLQGSLDRIIAQHQKLADQPGQKEKANEVLFYLYRARGDAKAAREAAEKARRQDLLVGLLEEQGRWEDLATRELPLEDRQEPERLGFRAAYARLAGRKTDWDQGIALLKKYAEEQDAAGVDRWNTAKMMLLNDSPDEALALMDKGWSAQKKLEILVARMRFKEALELAANPPEGAGKEAFEVVRARTLYFLGKKDEAKKAFAALGERIKPGNDFTWYESLIDAEYRLGMREQAFEHCARALVTISGEPSQARLLRKVLNGQEDTAQVWWDVLRAKQASEAPGVSMKSLRKLVAGEIKGKELASLVDELENVVRGRPPVPRLEGARHPLQAAGEVALKAGEETLAKVCFEKAAEQGKSASPLIKWGDHLARQKKWADAAEAYASAWDKDRRQPLALYLRGHALVQAGRQKEGEALMDQAHWLPLGDEELRMTFARELARRGHAEASRKSREMLLKTCVPGSFNAGEANRLAGIDAVRSKDFLKAAHCNELAMLRCLRVYISFIEPQAYVGVPHFIHRLRARGLTAAGKFDEAKKDIAFCESLLPANVDLAIHLVPVLEKLGRKKEADALYARHQEAQRKLVTEYPESAGLRNGVAWLAACCKRDLEEAQRHAEKAVELDPALPGYRDTLAEVVFQRGKKDEAIAHMKKCLELDPRRTYYQKQLKRFEAGDPKADLPPESED
jgi:predicted Zn-dependent protease